MDDNHCTLVSSIHSSPIYSPHNYIISLFAILKQTLQFRILISFIRLIFILCKSRSPIWNVLKWGFKTMWRRCSNGSSTRTYGRPIWWAPSLPILAVSIDFYCWKKNVGIQKKLKAESVDYVTIIKMRLRLATVWLNFLSLWWFIISQFVFGFWECEGNWINVGSEKMWIQYRVKAECADVWSPLKSG